MKLTKSKLKQFIKEELKNAGLVLEAHGEFDVENPEPRFTASPVWWQTMTDAILKKAQDMYRQAPDEGKEYMTKNFEMYVQEWREEQQAGPENELVDAQGQRE